MRLGQVLVTGASGFVGGHLVERASAQGISTVAVEGDLRRPQGARAAVAAARPSAVIHLAGVLPGGPTGACAALSDDAAMAANVLAAVAELAPEAPVLIPGSAAEYGLGSSEPLGESAPLTPVSPYGAAKLALERACIAMEGVRVIAARAFNHLGPGQSPAAPVAGWAWQLAEAERAGAGVLRTGELERERDLLDVRDVADAYLALVASDADGPVNVCSGRPRVLGAVVERMVELCSVDVWVEVDPGLVRSVDPPSVVGDPGRLRELTGWEPRIDLDRSLRDVLEDWRGRVRSGREPEPGRGARTRTSVAGPAA